MLIIVDAVNLLRNFLVQTFKLGKESKTHLDMVYESLNLLISETQLNLIELTKESRRTLSRFER